MGFGQVLVSIWLGFGYVFVGFRLGFGRVCVESCDNSGSCALVFAWSSVGRVCVKHCEFSLSVGPGVSSCGFLAGVVSVLSCSCCVGELVTSVNPCELAVDAGVSVVAGVVSGLESSSLSGGFGVRSS